MMSTIIAKIGRHLRKYRELKAITPEKLSRICGLHRTYIGSAESGERNITVRSLEKIANGLNDLFPSNSVKAAHFASRIDLFEIGKAHF